MTYLLAVAASQCALAFWNHRSHGKADMGKAAGERAMAMAMHLEDRIRAQTISRTYSCNPLETRN